MELKNENEAYAGILCGHLRQMVYHLRRLPEDKWDWTPDVAAPTARILATHACQWLMCDRQHINEPDTSKHEDVYEPSGDAKELCDALEAETNRWQDMILAFTPDQLAEERYQFGIPQAKMNIRGFICHMVQNCIYKNGQLATLYFALGLDGTDPYEAPFPNPIYAEMRQGWPNGTDG
jgi:hypothetical protein